MLKRIVTDHLRLGMHIHEFCGSWMAHPFWRSSFYLDDAGDLQRIRESGIRELWIDTAKGLDIEVVAPPEQAEAQAGPELDATGESFVMVERVSMGQEVRRAAAICLKSKEAVASMFSEVRMGRALDTDNALLVVDEISQSVLRNPSALISLARLKTGDEYTYMHSVAVCALMVVLSLQLGLDPAQTREAGMGGLLHDIGKMAIPLTILNKTGTLTNEEFGLIKGHSAEGYKLLLEGHGVSQIAQDICLHHHERIDGKGYPERLADGQISLYARMAAVCDVYDAITSDRPYKKGWNPAESLRKMSEWSGGQFDTVVFHAFVKSVGIYPVGTLVRLESGLLGVVIDQNEQSLLTPVVRVFFSAKTSKRLPPRVLDLSCPEVSEKIIGYEDPKSWGIADLRELWTSNLDTFST
jgi:HD-GYP domain-containing protein (c-di-GMP phosphodiesterase class II)